MAGNVPATKRESRRNGAEDRYTGKTIGGNKTNGGRDMDRIGRRLLGAMLAAALGLAHSAAVSEEAAKEPWLKVVVPIEIQNDGNFKSDDRGNQRNDFFATIEPEITVGILPGLTFYAHSVIEPLRDPRRHENRFFRSHGIYLQDL